MSEKSHVGMGFKVCPVCGCKHDEVVLLDKRLKDTLERDNFMGLEMCPEHQKLKDDGYTALVVVTNKETPTMHNAERTGLVMHIRNRVWGDVFASSAPLPPHGMCFIDAEAAAQLQARAKEQQNEQD